jgi:CheY-like chemotaxis protein
VESDRRVLEFLTRHLHDLGAETHPATSGEEASQLINAEKFDGVFVAFTLPSMNGLEVAERIRWSKSNSRCPIVLIMDSTKGDTLKQCFRAGINFFLEKPVKARQLQVLLNATRGLMLQERRRYQRVPVQIPALCEWTLQSFPQAAAGETINLSSSGVLLRLRHVPPPEAVVQMRFNLPGDPQPFNLTARVTRITADQQISLTFSGLTEEQRGRLMEFTSRVLGTRPAVPATR